MGEDPVEHEALVHHAEPPVQLHRVQLTQPPVLDPADDRSGGVQRRQLSLRRLQVVVGKGALDGELEERHPLRDQVANCCVAALHPQVARVKTVCLHGDERLGDESLLHAERPQCRAATRRVAVEGEDHLAAELAVVHQQPPQDGDVPVTEGRAAGGDGRRDARKVAGHHVGVALDQDGLTPLGDVSLGQIGPVQHGALLEQRCLRRIQVLRAVVVSGELARPEGDHVAGQVRDRPDQPAAELVDQAAAALACQAAGQQLGLGEAAAAQMPGERLPLSRRVANPEMPCVSELEAARGQEIASGQRCRAVQLLGVELRGRLVRR